MSIDTTDGIRQIGRMTKLTLVPSGDAPEPAPLLDAAGRLFRLKGFAATTIRDIAQEAGLWPGSVHYRYRTKEAVLLALMERGIGISEASFRSATEGVADPIERIRLAIRAHLAMLVGNDHGIYALLYEGRQLEGESRERMARLRDRYDALWDGLLYQAVGTGRLRPEVDVRLTRMLILGAVNWVPQWFSPGGTLGAEQVADAFADLILQGLLAPPAPARARSRKSTRRSTRGSR
ncbi:MAG: TetR/AcrR family transcriptional regulator [Gemmatimonadales bacterium]